MTIDQIIAAARMWRYGKFSTHGIAAMLKLSEHVIYNNMWRIRRVAAPNEDAA